jgi:predicted HTH domain antitoxin
MMKELAMTRSTILRADLSEKTREMVDRLHHGGMAVVEDSGQEQAVLLDPLDFRLLRALAQCAIDEEERAPEADDPDVKALQRYLAGDISLGKASELLGLNRFELQERFLRLGVPLRLGPATLEEARAEIKAARSLLGGGDR